MAAVTVQGVRLITSFVDIKLKVVLCMRSINWDRTFIMLSTKASNQYDGGNPVIQGGSPPKYTVRPAYMVHVYKIFPDTRSTLVGPVSVSGYNPLMRSIFYGLNRGPCNRPHCSILFERIICL